MTFATTQAGAALDAVIADGVTYYVGLVKGSAGLTDGSAANEATEAGYARQAVTFEDTPGNGRSKQNVAEVLIDFTESVSGLTHFIICTSATEGTNDVRAFGSLSSVQDIAQSAGGSIRWVAGAMLVQIAG